MWFHFFTGNHDAVGELTLQDMLQWFEAGLREAGHEVTAGNRLAPSAINLIWENSAPGHAAALRASGVTYGIVGTEIPDGTGFNWRTDSPWPQRWESFLEVAQGAAFIWSMIEASVPAYSRFAPTGYMELGYSELLVPYQSRWDPQFDFGFYGLLTPHRQAVLDELGRYCRIVTPKSMLSPGELLAFIAQCRIGINFRQSPQWPIPSPTRLGRLLHSKRCAVSEFVPVPTRQGAFAAIAEEGRNFADFCLERLSRNWKQDAEDAFCRYRSSMPMRVIVERLFDETIQGNSRISRRIRETSDDSRLECPALHCGNRVTLVEEYREYNIVRTSDSLVAVAHECGPLDVAATLAGHAPLPPVDRFFGPIDPLDQLKQKIDFLRAAQAERSRAPQIIETYLGFNIIRWMDQHVAVAENLGEVDVVAVLVGTAPKPPAEQFIVSVCPLDQLRRQINEICEMARNREQPPQVVEAYDGFNIIYCSGEFVAVSQALGAVDISAVMGGKVPLPEKKDFLRVLSPSDQLKQSIRSLHAKDGDVQRSGDIMACLPRGKVS